MPLEWKQPLIHYRTFRNDDPPGLVDLWNEACSGRGVVRMPSATPMDYFVFSKPYFDPAGLILACAGDVPVGFVHSGFVSNAEQTALSTATGIICVLGVRPAHRGKGIGTELLRRAEEYLHQRGARNLLAGSRTPGNPFYFGLLGGSDSPGILASDANAETFFSRRGYVPGPSTSVLHRALPRQALNFPDPRFFSLRSRFEICYAPRPGVASWWKECVLGPVELMELRLQEKSTHEPVASMGLWEMQGFSQRWAQAALGIVDLTVRQDLRRKGLARFLVASMLKQAQEQYFNLVEVQVPDDNQPALALFRSLAFEQTDVGRICVKSGPDTAAPSRTEPQ
jgi:ribosomal protein S18 acetylase RimI-like enzyme